MYYSVLSVYYVRATYPFGAIGYHPNIYQSTLQAVTDYGWYMPTVQCRYVGLVAISRLLHGLHTTFANNNEAVSTAIICAQFKDQNLQVGSRTPFVSCLF